MAVIIPDVPRNLDPYLYQYFTVLMNAIMELQKEVKELKDAN